MALTTDHSITLSNVEPPSAPHTFGMESAIWWQKLAAADLSFVRLCTHATRYRVIRRFSVMISRLGNGWIYPILMVIIIFEAPRNAIAIIITSALNASILHVIYPTLKKVFRRRRPFQIDPALKSLLATLDDYSFPSGHVMTLSGVLLPVILTLPEATMLAFGLILVMGWSRVATAHHFLSDVLVGALVGVVIASPASDFMLQKISN